MMKNFKRLSFVGTCLIVLLSNCAKKDAVDTEYPNIDLSGPHSLTIHCGTFNRGGVLKFNGMFTDNMELGSFSLDIHHNFDQHAHSTELASCSMDAIKTAVKPMVFINTYNIPAGKNRHTAEVEIPIPADIDPGDYHFMIKVTDKEGWQTIKGLSFKIK